MHRSELLKAAKRGDVAELQAAGLARIIRFHDKNLGLDLMHAACVGNQVAVCAYLLSLPDIDINGRDRHGSTPLHHARYWGGNALVRLLLDDPRLDVNVVDRFGNSPVHAPWPQLRVKHLTLLLASGRPIRHRRELEAFPLYATFRSHPRKTGRVLRMQLGGAALPLELHMRQHQHQH